MRLGAMVSGIVAALVLVACARKQATTRPVPEVHHLGGVVVDEQGAPVRGAHVRIVSQSSRESATSRADGSFEFALQSGEYLGGAYSDDLVSEPIMLAIKDHADRLVVRMHRAATVTFQIVDADDGKPIAAATVTGLFGQTGTTTADGRVTVRGLGSHSDMLVVRAPGHVAADELLTFDAHIDMNVERVIKLQRGASVSGTVIDPDGKILANATVHISRIGEANGRPTVDVRSDAHGAWSSAPLARGTYGVTADSKQHGQAPALVIEVDGVHDRTDIRVRVNGGARLVTTVATTDGRPVPRATVMIVANDSTWQETADEHGKLDMNNLPAGAYSVWAYEGTRASQRAPVDLTTNKRTDVKLVVVESSISGTVVSSKGVPEAGIMVFARPKTFNRDAGRYDTTDSHGHFNVGGVPPGEYELTTSRGIPIGPRFDELVVHAGDRAVRIALSGNASVRGRVVMNNNPVGAFGVIVSEPEEHKWRQVGLVSVASARDGRFAKQDVSVGKRVVIVFGPGFARKLVPVELHEGDDLDLGDITVDHGQRVTGRVTDATGAPVADAVVEEFQAGPVRVHDNDPSRRALQGRSTATTDANGNYTIEDIPPPTWTPPGKTSPIANRIGARHPERGVAPARDLPVSATTADFALRLVGGIDGRVAGSQTDQTYVHAMLVSHEGEPASARVGADRSFHFDNLVEGEYEITLSRQNWDGFLLPPTRVKVEAGKRATPTITLAPTAPLRVRVVDGTCQVAMVVKRGASPPKTFDLRVLLGYGLCDGRAAEIANVPPGAYRVCIDETHCTDASMTTPPAAATIEIRSKP